MSSIAEMAGEDRTGFIPRPAGIYRLIDRTMNDHRMQERILAVIALGESRDPRAVRPLIDCCYDKNPELRWHAIVALGMIRSGRGVDALVERLRDPQERGEIRERAAMALAAIGSLSAIAGLKEVLAAEAEDSAIRSSITASLGRAAAL